MKDLAILICIAAILFAAFTGEKKKVFTPGDVGSFQFGIVPIGDCEYVAFPTAGAYVSIIHKGDCKNKIHRKSRELE